MQPPSEDLFKYFVEQTDKRFEEVMKSLDDLKDFKVRTLVGARWISLVVSAVCGAATFAASAGLTLYLAKDAQKPYHGKTNRAASQTTFVPEAKNHSSNHRRLAKIRD